MLAEAIGSISTESGRVRQGNSAGRIGGANEPAANAVAIVTVIAEL